MSSQLVNILCGGRNSKYENKPLQNHTSQKKTCDMWQKTIKTPNKVAGPVGKEGVLGGVNRYLNAGKNITEPVTK